MQNQGCSTKTVVIDQFSDLLSYLFLSSVYGKKNAISDTIEYVAQFQDILNTEGFQKHIIAPNLKNKKDKKK